MFITFVIPVYNESKTLEELVRAIEVNVGATSHRLIMIDDGSTDDSGDVLDALACGRKTLEVIRFDRNRGKTEALREGFARSEGDVVITMDSDLQDDPVEIPRFLEALDQGYDLVCGWKASRQDPLTKRLASKVYNGIAGGLFGLPLHDMNCGYKAMRLEVAKSLVLEHDYHRLIPVLASQQGYKIGEIEVRHHRREFGKSKYGLERYWHGSRDVFRLWLKTRGKSGK